MDPQFREMKTMIIKNLNTARQIEAHCNELLKVIYSFESGEISEDEAVLMIHKKLDSAPARMAAC